MNRLCDRGPALLGLLIWFVASTPAPAATTCPTAHQVSGTFQGTGWKVVFLPYGFKDGELDDFRCAVRLLSDGLANDQSLGGFWKTMDVYRLDVVTPADSACLVAKPCRSPSSTGSQSIQAVDSCEPHPLAWPEDKKKLQCAGDNNGAAVPCAGCQETVTADLQVCPCPDESPQCDVVWPTEDGANVIHNLATDCVGADAVIVLVNSKSRRGGGHDESRGVPRVAVVTLWGVDDDHGGRSGLLAHEFGHVLGLLDEYTDKRELSTPESGRNIANVPDLKAGVPWDTLCTAYSRPGCENGSWDGKPCQVVVSDDCNCSDGASSVLASPKPEVGLWQGAFYDSCIYFRSQLNCNMESIGHPLCKACMAFLQKRRRTVDEFLLAPAGAGAPESTDLTVGTAFPTAIVQASLTALIEAPSPRGSSILGASRVVSVRGEVDLPELSGEIEVDSFAITLRAPAWGGARVVLRGQRKRRLPADSIVWTLQAPPALKLTESILPNDAVVESIEIRDATGRRSWDTKRLRMGGIGKGLESRPTK